MQSSRPRRLSAGKAPQRWGKVEEQAELEGDEINEISSSSSEESEAYVDEDSDSEQEEEEVPSPRTRKRTCEKLRKEPPNKNPRAKRCSNKKKEESDEDEDSEEDEMEKEEGGQLTYETGTFLLGLSDLELKNHSIKRIHCIWRVDSSQLLQKYDPERTGDLQNFVISENYKGGWDPDQSFHPLTVEKVTNDHGKVKVRLPTVHQIYSADPSQSGDDDDKDSDVNDVNVTTGSQAVSPQSLPSGSNSLSSELVESLGGQFDIYIQVLLSQATDSLFLKTIQRSNVVYFMTAIEKIEKETVEKRLEKAAGRIAASVRQVLDKYPFTDYSQISAKCKCKNCDSSEVRKLLIAEGEAYDWETLEATRGERGRELCVGLPLCGDCSDLADAYHSLRHIRFHLFRAAYRKLVEAKCETVSKDDPDVVSYIMEHSRGWLESVKAPYYKSLLRLEEDV